MRLLTVLLSFLTLGCGGAVVAPSPSVPASAPLPAPSVVRWEPGRAFHHCFGPGVDRALAQWAADIMSELTGTPQTQAGPCNITWALDPDMEDGTQAYSVLSGGATVIEARLVFRNGERMWFHAAHETGHVMGLAHTSDRDDCMFSPGASNVREFNARERALIRSLYPH